MSVRSFTGDANFWLIGVGIALALCVPVGSGVFFVRHLEEIGISRASSALVVSVMAVCSLIGKLGVGLLADRVDRRGLVVVTLVAHVLGLYLLATGATLSTMFVAAVPLGLGGGGFIPLPGILQGACFGRLVIGRIGGMHAFVGLPFLLAAAPVVGLAASSTGSFVAPFLALGGVQLLAAVLLACVRIPRIEPGAIDAAGAV
jgi:MFS family permease